MNVGLVNIMINALNVSNNILYRAELEGYCITNIKLHRLLCFVYKQYIKKSGMALFSERFETWSRGPVIASIYDAFKSYNDRLIKDLYYDCDGIAWCVDRWSNADFRESISFVYDKYMPFSGIQLSMVICMDNTAWHKAKIAGKQFLDDDDIRNEAWFDVV